MENPQLFRTVKNREFFAHHSLLHAAELEIQAAEDSRVGCFNKCLASMVMTSIAVESLLNAVGSRVVSDWPFFERLRPHEKIDALVVQLQIERDTKSEPWITLRFLGDFRNDIVHAKPEKLVQQRILSEVALEKTAFDRPQSKLEREITTGNARRVLSAVISLKDLLTGAMPNDKRFGIYADMSSSSTATHEV